MAAASTREAFVASRQFVAARRANVTGDVHFPSFLGGGRRRKKKEEEEEEKKRKKKNEKKKKKKKKEEEEEHM
ncbi:hypothetical protein PoB_005142800 [Plakobranchus ocellatus]|uniref:Uncharacterized protein n=1 Tax=Plakobranchus ocellatus TaxID=259542 RepID=A0AAV4BZ66_9GAST|nr:hypothetical protein PoB_005142800 [Plakobranchus ocellatus]